MATATARRTAAGTASIRNVVVMCAPCAAASEATALQRKLAQEADDKLLADLKAKGVQVTTVEQSSFVKATGPVTEKWLAGPIGPYVKKVVAASRGQ